ncbi:zinc finger MYM-type protein 1-like [Myzus persicae]|uniref:zinc finger MYM-type protein 1-like n=1 Tax=Myzus persicae TaxID=13164 RepID=UPI000B933D8E|nr:zinc finger MYM-type protein 1-like [Myzus persicae]
MQNGETAYRDWILYSNSKNALFCFYCLLFGGHKTSFEDQSRGFINWKNCYKQVGDHEKSSSHVKSIQTWHFRISNNGQSRIDNIVQKQISDSLSYWKNVLYRIVETLKFLTSRSLEIRGSNETLGSVHNGNYLGCLELIAKFDPFISQHLIKYGNKGRGNVSYISSTICTEFIMVMGEAVIKEIVSQIQSRKYFSIIVDSTPDITKIDQLTIAIRYVMSDGFPIERFIGFLPSVGHKGEGLEKAIINKFSELNINIENCRGQAYDNASNMSGMHNGLQSRIKLCAPTAEFIPCSAHSFNLVGSNAAESTSFGNDKQTINIKKLSTTRWSSRYDVCKALYLGYNRIKNALEDIIKDQIQKQETHNEASSILNKLDSLDFAFMICLWTPILKRFNATSVTLQSTNIDLSTVTKLYKS